MRRFLNIRKLTRQAYPAANSDLIDTLALDHFIDSLLDSEIRIRLRECCPKTIQEAETLAVKMEAQRIADRQRSKAVGSVTTESADDTGETDEMSKLAKTMNSLVDKVEKLQNRQGSRDFQHKGGNNSQNKANFHQNRSQRPNSNFSYRNRYRGNNWQNNGNQNRNNFSKSGEQRNYGFNQSNNAFRQQQQGNENRSSLGAEARPSTM